MEEKKGTKKEKTLWEKIGEIQGKIDKIERGKENPYFNHKYFDINDLLAVLMPLLQEQGIMVNQPLTSCVDNDGRLQPVLRTLLRDKKEELVFDFPLIQDSNPQKVGSTITYYRRYCLQSLFCLQAEDDDGNKATQSGDETTQKGQTEKKKTSKEFEL